MSNNWLLLIDPPRPGAINMALDEALLWAAEQRGLHALRLYAWNPATLSFGRNEPALKRYDREQITERRVATVRRPTGGRAVWHDREVTYSVCAPVATFGSLPETYRAIHSLLSDALVSLGAPVTLAPDRAAVPVGAGACFATPAGGEVVTASGAKVVGSAQVRSGSAFLQHGSILLEAGQSFVSSLTVGAAEAPFEAGLSSLIPGQAGWESVAGAVATAARRQWHAPEADSIWPADVLEQAEVLAKRYADDTWTWRR